MINKKIKEELISELDCVRYTLTHLYSMTVNELAIVNLVLILLTLARDLPCEEEA